MITLDDESEMVRSRFVYQIKVKVINLRDDQLDIEATAKSVKNDVCIK